MNINATKVRVVLLAIALLAGLGAGVAQAQPNWCQICSETGDCWACCRCAGGSQLACLHACGGFQLPEGDAATTPPLPLEPEMCSATAADRLPPATELPAALAAAPAANPPLDV